MSRLEIKVDVLGQMKNTISTFADRYCFIDEMVQNAQRAKAPSVRFEVTPTEIRVKDSGCGCANLQDVFTQSLSGWGADVKAAENPFGFGFFSCIVVADDILVRSGSTEARFDVAKMFAESRTDVITETYLAQPIKGFEVVLRALKNVRENLVRTRVAKVAKYVDIKVYLDGDECAQQSMLRKDDLESAMPFARVCKSDSFRGVLYPIQWGSLKTYLCGREVGDVWFDGLGGRVEIVPGKVNPRCPDRKAWIEDEAYYSFRREVGNYARKVMLDVVREGTDEQINRFESNIERTLKPEDYIRHLRFDVDAGAKIVDALAAAKPEDLAEEGMTTDRLLEQLAYKPENAPAAEVGSQRPATESKAATETENFFNPASPTFGLDLTRQYVLVDGVVQARKVEKPGFSLADLKKRALVVYVLKSDAIKYVDAIREARYYGADVVVLQNKLQLKAIETLKKNCVHVSEIQKSLRRRAHLDERGPSNPAEARAEKLLNLMASAAGAEGQVVEVAKVQFTSEGVVNGVATGKTLETEEGTLAAACDGRIYVQRAAIPTSIVADVTLESPLTAADKSFIARMLNTMSHELAHLLQGLPDGDVAFYEAQLVLQDKIIKALL